MKFACEHCGRSYAVADELRGKTFKMKCRACGHAIVVKGGQAAEPAGKARGTAGKAEATPSPVTITGAPPGDEPPSPALGAPDENPFLARPVSAASLGSRAASQHRDEPMEAGLPPPPDEQYIDLVLDEEKVAEEPVEAEPEPRRGPPPRRDGSEVPDPFADWKPLGEIQKGPLAGQVEPRQFRPPRETPPPPLPRPRHEPWPEPPPPRPPAAPQGLNPKVLLVAGGVAVAAVLVLLFVFVGRGGKAPGATVAATPEPAPAAAPRPPVAAPPQPSPAPATAEPIPALAEPEPPREEPPKRRAEPAPRRPKPAKVAREERRAEPRPEPPRRAPAPEPPRRQVAAAPTATPSASGAQPKATGQLTPQQVARIVSANKRAFEQCIAEAGKRDPGLELAGRQVTLMLTVSPNGKVAYPTIDDVELNKTDLGACIKSAARIMMFPTFEGEPMKVEVPLSLGR